MIAGVDPHLARRAGPAGRARRRARRGHDADARRPHERRRRRGRLHRQPRRGALRPRVPDAAGQHLRHDRAGRARLRHLRCSSRPPTAHARTATTGPATRSTCGRSPTPPTWRCWARQGFAEVGEPILQRSHYAAARIAADPRLSVRVPDGFFKEFVVDFSAAPAGGSRRSTPRCASAASSAAATCRPPFPELGQSALYCVTEIHTQEDIDRLADALAR